MTRFPGTLRSLRALRPLVVALGLVCFGEMARTQSALANSPYSSQQRQATIGRVLAALQSTSKTQVAELKEFVDDAEKHLCRSFFDTLTLNCLHAEVKKNCENGSGRRIPACAPLSDLFLVNKVNERQFLSRQERFRIAQKAENYAKAYEKMLDNKYAVLSVEMLRMTPENCGPRDYVCQARQIDQYCQKNADSQNIAWQACVSALSWFVSQSD